MSRLSSRLTTARIVPSLLWLLLLPSTAAAGEPKLIGVKKVWDQAPHNAFTDLIRFRDRFYCVFREAEDHVGGDGEIRVLTSDDGEKWRSTALLKEKCVDLRDPRLSITPDSRLMIVAGGSVYRGTTTLLGMQPRVAFSRDGAEWTGTKRILSEGDWLWRVTWHAGTAYGVAYRLPKPPDSGERKSDWLLSLCSSKDGVNYERITALEVTGRPSETTLRFLPDGEMIALVRRSEGNKNGWIGSSRPPYTKWTWHETEYRLGGPNFIRLPNGQLWAGSRWYRSPPEGPVTILVRMTPTSYEPVLTLPSGGDTSYPGFVWHDSLLWMSYYSSHEGKSNIYLAKIRLE